MTKRKMATRARKRSNLVKVTDKCNYPHSGCVFFVFPSQDRRLHYLFGFAPCVCCSGSSTGKRSIKVNKIAKMTNSKILTQTSLTSQSESANVNRIMVTAFHFALAAVPDVAANGAGSCQTTNGTVASHGNAGMSGQNTKRPATRKAWLAIKVTRRPTLPAQRKPTPI